MNKFGICLFLGVIFLQTPWVGAQRLQSIDLSNPVQRRQIVEQIRQESEARKAEAIREANKKGWPLKGTTDEGAVFELIALDSQGNPIYKITENSNAAITSAASFIRQTSPYNLTGLGQIAGVWDEGGARTDHQEFGGRASIRDSASWASHASHVSGTMIASGINAAAQGMAPEASLYCYDWNSDTSEMTSQAATGPGQASKIYLSNHSYGTVTGWAFGNWSGTFGHHFWGNYPSEREDSGFGCYGGDAPDWDSLVHSAQYYLPFKSAGNDRNDVGPPNGETFFYRQNGSWRSATYQPSTGPLPDNFDRGGYDTIPDTGNAKNIMTVGAVDDAVLGGVRNLSMASMLSFSGWGPSDDGRIKPDIVANGGSLYSTDSDSAQSYSAKSGTSMACPNAAGSALLLIEYYARLFPGQSMLASTLKGLMIHTTDDLGNAGPDYRYGWGLLNAKTAADQIRAHSLAPSGRKITEGLLTTANTSDSYSFRWDGISPIRATLCWTDPPHAAISGLDNTQRTLINDLDLRIDGPGGAPLYLPYILNPSDPEAVAQTGDNIRDNVEQVYIASPSASGTYTVRVYYKNALQGGQQKYSLILSGQAEDDLLILPADDFLSRGEPGGPFSPISKTFNLLNNGSSILSWNAVKTQTWTSLSSPSGTLQPGQSTLVTVSINGGAESFPASGAPYTDEIGFTNQASGVTQTRSVFLRIANDYFTQLFVENNDLRYVSFTFHPDGAGGYLGICREQRLGFWVHPDGGTPVSLEDEDYLRINLSGGAIFPFFGQNYSSFYIGSNGYITFTSGDTTYSESLENHFNMPRISALFNDLDPTSSGTISWKEMQDRAVVTFEGVSEYDFSNWNSFQIEMFFDGRIRLTYLEIDSFDGLIGISRGEGLPADFVNSDFSVYPSCNPQTAVEDGWNVYR